MEQNDGIASITDNGSGFGFQCRNVPQKAIGKMCNEGERPKARKVLNVENLIADLDEMCSSVLI